MDIIWGGTSNPGDNRVMADWAARQIWPRSEKKFGECTTMGVVINEELAGVVVYHDYCPDARIIEFSGAAINRRWITRRTLHEMFAYPFEHLNLQMVVTRNSPQDNPHLQRMLEAYNFSRFLIPRLFGREKDGVLHTLTQEDWRSNRFERKKNG